MPFSFEAMAQPASDGAGRAQALFVEGAALLDKGEVALACPKLEAAVTLTRREALGGMLVLEECYERVGKLASAWGLASEIVGKARASGQTERADEAQRRYEALSPRLHKIALKFEPKTLELDGLRVLVNGVEQPRQALESPIPVDAGALVVQVSATGSEPVETRFEVPEAPGESSVIVAGPAPQTKKQPSDVVPQTSYWGAQRIAGVSIAAVGALSSGAGLILAGVAASNYDAAFEEQRCSGEPLLCDDVGPIDAARGLGDLATGFVLAGLGLATVGVVVWLTGSDAVELAPANAARVQLGFKAGAVFLEVKSW